MSISQHFYTAIDGCGDGRRILYSMHTQPVRLLDAQTGALIAEFQGHTRQGLYDLKDKGQPGGVRAVAPAPGLSWQTILSWFQYSMFRYFNNRGYGLLPTNTFSGWSEGFSRQGQNAATVSIDPHTSVARLYESFAFGASSIAPAVGHRQMLNSIFAIEGGQQNLSISPDFGSRFNDQPTGHSAQFIHSAIAVGKYWAAIKLEVQSG